MILACNCARRARGGLPGFGQAEDRDGGLFSPAKKLQKLRSNVLRRFNGRQVPYSRKYPQG